MSLHALPQTNVEFVASARNRIIHDTSMTVVDTFLLRLSVFVNRTSWEFPEIVIGKYRMISDADGKQYPWYGSKTEVQTLEGPTLQPTFVTVHMNDNFFPQVAISKTVKRDT
jgi:hypothetical protein